MAALGVEDLALYGLGVGTCGGAGKRDTGEVIDGGDGGCGETPPRERWWRRKRRKKRKKKEAGLRNKREGKKKG